MTKKKASPTKYIEEQSEINKMAITRRTQLRVMRTGERIIQILGYGLTYAFAIVVDYLLFELTFYLLQRDSTDILVPLLQELLFWLRFATLLAGIVCATIHLAFSVIGQIRLEIELYKDDA